MRFDGDVSRLEKEDVIVPCFPATGGGDCNADKRLLCASPRPRFARLFWILLGTSGVILYSQLASDVFTDSLPRPKRADTRTVVAMEK